MNSKSQHKAIKLNVGKNIISVDEGIVPVIKWLNQFTDVKTLFSCQGSASTSFDNSDSPYVSFTTKNIESLYDVMKVITDFGYELHADPFVSARGEIWTSTYRKKPILHIGIYFGCTKSLSEFINFIS